MATYKVIQDIEAEDKLLGPLTLRQFIYAGIAALFLYLSFLSLTKHAVFLLVLFLPIAGLAGFFAFPWGRDQPTEVWALAKVRFLFKPHRRVWDQSGVKELVTITAPKQVITNYTNGLTQTEVDSRLRALADTIDSRGWAIKNVNVNLYSQPIAGIGTVGASDRLIDPQSLPQDVSSVDVQASDDMLDEQSNPIAQHFSQMINASSQSRRQQIKDRLRQATTRTPSGPTVAAPGVTTTPPNDYWFLSQPAANNLPGGTVAFDAQVVAPGTDTPSGPVSAADEEAINAELKAHHVVPGSYYPNVRTIQPLSKQTVPAAPALAVPAPVTPSPDPAILNLASNNDLNVATLARQVSQKNSTESADGEVVISLH